jgi:hypothetical protein
MITSLELKMDVISELLGICVEKKDPAPKSGETLQIYIPTLMPNIAKSIPTKKNTVTNKGSKLFLNDPACRPPSKTTLTTQNYLTGKLARNHVWMREENSRIQTRDLVNPLDQGQLKVRYEANCSVEGHPVRIKFLEDYRVYYTIGEERIRCYAPNGKFSKLLFDDDKYID